jgi:hypothetical protein
MNNIRRNSISGLYESSDGLMDLVSLHFTEWWNGEGMDFTFYDKSKEKRFDLHADEIRALAIVAVASGFLELKEVQEQADQLNHDSEQRAREMKKFKEDYDKKWEYGI